MERIVEKSVEVPVEKIVEVPVIALPIPKPSARCQMSDAGGGGDGWWICFYEAAVVSAIPGVGMVQTVVRGYL